MFLLHEEIRREYKETCLSDYSIPENVSSIRIACENGQLQILINCHPVHIGQVGRDFFLDITKADIHILIEGDEKNATSHSRKH